MNEPDIDDQPDLNAVKEWPEMDLFDVRLKTHRGGRDIPVPVAARNVHKNSRVGANRSARRIEHAAGYAARG